MNFNDHNPAHFHVEYAGKNAMVEIESIAFSRGNLPTPIQRMVIEWATIHQNELRELWAQRRSDRQLRRIPPLE